MNPKIIGYNEDKFYRATIISIDPDPREYDGNGKYIHPQITTKEGWEQNNAWKANERVKSWNKYLMTLFTNRLNILFNFKVFFLNIGINLLKEEEKLTQLREKWRKEREDSFKNMNEDKLSKESAAYALEKTQETDEKEAAEDEEKADQEATEKEDAAEKAAAKITAIKRLCRNSS